MPTASSFAFEERIIGTMEKCLAKMADHLEENFHATDKDSLSFFRLFCSACRTHMNYLKFVVTRMAETDPPISHGAKKPPSMPVSPPPTHRNGEKMTSNPKSNGLLLPEFHQNGLLVRP